MSKSNLPPHSVEIEQALLGACMIDPERAALLLESVHERHFFLAKHRLIWNAYQRCHARHGTLDYQLICDDLENAGQLETVGGPAYVAALGNVVPAAIHAREYAATLELRAAQRAGLEVAGAISRLCHGSAESAAALFDQIATLVAQTGQQYLGERAARPLSVVAHEILEQLVALEAAGQASGLLTGFHDFDRLTGGLHPADLTLVAARPGVGKTTWLTTLALNLIQRQRRVLFCTLEMTNAQLVRKLLATTTHIDAARLRNAQVAEHEWQPLQEGVERLAPLPLWLNDTTTSLTHIRTTAQLLALRHGLDLVIIDYLQLVTTGRRFPNRTEEVGFVSGQLKTLARDLEIPVVSAAQLNRALEYRADKRPTLADLRESGRLEQDADLVLFLHRPGLYDPMESDTLTELILAKHRHGPTGTVQLIFQPQWQAFAGAALPSPEVAHG